MRADIAKQGASLIRRAMTEAAGPVRSGFRDFSREFSLPGPQSNARGAALGRDPQVPRRGNPVNKTARTTEPLVAANSRAAGGIGSTFGGTGAQSGSLSLADLPNGNLHGRAAPSPINYNPSVSPRFRDPQASSIGANAGVQPTPVGPPGRSAPFSSIHDAPRDTAPMRDYGSRAIKPDGMSHGSEGPRAHNTTGGFGDATRRGTDTPYNTGPTRTREHARKMGEQASYTSPGGEHMTGPSIASNASVNPTTPSGAGIDAGTAAVGMGMIGLTATGAAVGAGTSYMTGGNIGQGALAGAVGGAAMGMGGGRMAGNAMVGASKWATGTTTNSFSRNLVGMTSAMSSATGRAGTFAAGGMLGGFTFGGNKSHKRGFNRNRGNSIGR